MHECGTFETFFKHLQTFTMLIILSYTNEPFLLSSCLGLSTRSRGTCTIHP